MKFILAAVLFVAVAQAAIQPRNIEIPEYALHPRLTGAEWQQILANQIPKAEVVANYKPGTKKQIDGAGAIRGNFDSKIIGGSNAVAAQFPWQVSITMDGSYFCGASIISENWVLTAGHCVDGITTFKAVFGSLSPDGGAAGTSSQTSRTSILHENYDANNISDDIGLIKLTTALAWSSSVGPVRLPSRSLVGTTFAGESARVSGWGKTSDSILGGISQVLKFADLDIIANTVCAETYGDIIRSTTLCANTDNGQSTCNGDSGGPLVFQESDGLYTEIGIVSFGSSAGCTRGYDVAFTRVTEYLGWIETNSGIIIE